MPEGGVLTLRTCAITGAAEGNDLESSDRVIVEVSDTTLSHDCNRKASLYAAARIQDYWIVNLVDRLLEVYRAPVSDPCQPFRLSYSQRTNLSTGDTVSPLALPQAQIAVADLFP